MRFYYSAKSEDNVTFEIIDRLIREDSPRESQAETAEAMNHPGCVVVSSERKLSDGTRVRIFDDLTVREVVE